jgi:U3 small nucleolar RNA-associated protein 20
VAAAVWAPHAYLLPLLGLQLLVGALKRPGRLDVRDYALRSLLAPLPEALVAVLPTPQPRVAVAALKVLAALVPTGLPVPLALVPQLFVVLEGSPSAAGEVAQACLRTLTALLKPGPGSLPDDTVGPAQLARLVSLLRPELRGGASDAATATTFALVRALVGRGWLSPALYDLMDAVAEALVQAQAATVRTAARAVFVAYMLQCPIGPARLQGHLAFLAQQLGAYAYESGREAALATLAALVDALPDPTVQTVGVFLVVPLAVAVVHDPATTLRAGAAAVLRRLLARLDASRLDDVWALLTRWWAAADAAGPSISHDPDDDNVMALDGPSDASVPPPSSSPSSLDQAATQVATLLLEARVTAAGSGAGGLTVHLPALSAHLLRRLGAFAAAASPADPHMTWLSTPEAAVTAVAPAPAWQGVYYTLGLASRALPLLQAARPAASATLLEAATVLLAHPHAWVQRGAGRLVGAGLATIDPATLTGPAAQPSFLSVAPARLLGVARALLVQLASPHLEADATEQLAKNLFFVARCLHLHPAVGRMPNDDDNDEDDDESEGEGQAESGAGAAAAAAAAVAPGVLWLCRRLAFRARRASARPLPVHLQQQTLVFRWYAGVASWLPPPITTALLPAMLPGLVRALDIEPLPSQPQLGAALAPALFHSYNHTQPHTHTQTVAHALACTRTRTHTHTYSHAHGRTRTHPRPFFFRSFSLAYAHSHTVTDLSVGLFSGCACSGQRSGRAAADDGGRRAVPGGVHKRTRGGAAGPDRS